MGIIVRTLSRYRGLGLAFGGRRRFSFLLNEGIAFVLILASVGSCSNHPPHGEDEKSEPPAATTRAVEDRVSLDAELIRRGANSELRIKGTGWPEYAVLVVNIRSRGELSMPMQPQDEFGVPFNDAVLARSAKNTNHAVLTLDLDRLSKEASSPLEARILLLTSLYATHFVKTGPISAELRERRRLTGDSFGQRFTVLKSLHTEAPAQVFKGAIDDRFYCDEKEYWQLSYFKGRDAIARIEIPLSGK